MTTGPFRMSVALPLGEATDTVFGRTTRLEAGFDLDALTTSGMFTVVLPDNGPTSSDYFITVFAANITGKFRCLQIAADVASGAEYARTLTDTGWSSWVAYATTAVSVNAALLSGTGAPNDSFGSDGDFYIDTDTYTIYGPKSGGAWDAGTSLVGPQGIQGIQGDTGDTGLQGPQGVQGPQGNSILTGNGAPSSGTGSNGDLYVDLTNGVIYGAKTAGSWPGSGTSLVGPTGATGSAGPTGSGSTHNIYVYNVVIDYSADNTGASSANTAIQNAIDAANAAGGGIVYIPRGTYKMTAPGSASSGCIQLKDNVAVIGDGMGVSILKCADFVDSSVSGIMRTPSGVENSNIRVQDLTLDGNLAAQTGVGNITVFFCGVTPGDRTHMDRNISMIRVEAKGGKNGTAPATVTNAGYGFDPHEMTDGLYFFQCIAHDNQKDGFVLDGNINFLLEGCKSYSNGRHGFNFVTQSYNGIVKSCQAYSNGTLTSGNNYIIAEDSNTIIIDGCLSSLSNVEGIKIRRGATVTNTRCTVKNCIAQTSNRAGITINGANYNHIIANTLYDNGQTTNNTYHDITVIGDDGNSGTKTASSYNVINGTFAAATLTNKTKYGINEEASYATNNVYYGNTFLGQATGSYSTVDATSQILTGATGPQGATGSTGATGAAGANGTNGNTILNGSGAPSNGTGANGDFYIDTTNSRLYGPKTSGSWPGGYLNLVGATGASGNTILSASGVPSNGTGNDGDFYIDTATNKIYGPKASGSWPAGQQLTGGTASAAGSTLEFQYNDAGVFNGSTGWTYDKTNARAQAVNPIELSGSTPSAASANKAFLHGYKRANLTHLGIMNEFGAQRLMQQHIGHMTFAALIGGGSSVTAIGTPSGSGAGTAAVPSYSTATRAQSTKRTQLPSAASTNSSGGIRMSSNFCVRGNSAGVGGYFVSILFSLNTIDGTNTRGFVGLYGTSSAFAAADAAPSALTTSCFGIGFDPGQTTWRLTYGNGTTTQVDLGSNFPVAVNTLYELVLYCKPNDSKIYYSLINLETGNHTEGSLTSGIPAAGTFMNPQVAVYTGSGSAAATIDLAQIYAEFPTF